MVVNTGSKSRKLYTTDETVAVSSKWPKFREFNNRSMIQYWFHVAEFITMTERNRYAGSISLVTISLWPAPWTHVAVSSNWRNFATEIYRFEKESIHLFVSTHGFVLVNYPRQRKPDRCIVRKKYRRLFSSVLCVVAEFFVPSAQNNRNTNEYWFQVVEILTKPNIRGRGILSKLQNFAEFSRAYKRTT